MTDKNDLGITAVVSGSGSDDVFELIKFLTIGCVTVPLEVKFLTIGCVTVPLEVPVSGSDEPVKNSDKMGIL
jgi:hypothetical protein